MIFIGIFVGGILGSILLYGCINYYFGGGKEKIEREERERRKLEEEWKKERKARKIKETRLKNKLKEKIDDKELYDLLEKKLF